MFRLSVWRVQEKLEETERCNSAANKGGSAEHRRFHLGKRKKNLSTVMSINVTLSSRLESDKENNESMFVIKEISESNVCSE